MGLIKNIFGAIFGLIGGIFGGLGRVLGLGKKSEFFMELDESSSNAPKIEAPQSADKVLPAAVQKGEMAKPAANAKATEKAQPAPAKPVAVSPVPDTVNFATDYLVNPGSTQNGRRRPGPSLSPFLDLARQVKAPAR